METVVALSLANGKGWRARASLSSQPRRDGGGGGGAAKGPSEDLEMGFPLSGDTEDWFLPHP